MSLQPSSKIAHFQRANSPPFRQKQVWSGIGSIFYCRNATAKTIPEHEHSDHALLISLNGTIWLNMPSNGDRQLQKLSVGSIAITPANVKHSAILDEGAEFIILHLEPEFVTRSAENLTRQSTLKPLLLPTDTLIHSIGITLKTEMDAKCDRFYTESLFNALSCHLLKLYFHRRSLPSNSRLATQKLSDAIDYIDTHLSSAIVLEDLASVLNISRYHFCHLFKQSFGIAPYQYILQRRVERAKQLLRRQELSLAEIALACGFANQSHFTKHFRQQTGSTPKQYRQEQVASRK